MFPEVNHVLKLDQHSLIGCRVSIVEEDDSMPDFLVHHFVSLAAFNKQNVLLLSFEHTIGHYHSVSLKLGGNILKKREAGELIFMEGLKSVAQGYSGKGGVLKFLAGGSDLNDLFGSLRDVIHLQTNGLTNGFTIIIDKITSLLLLGVALKDVVKFVENLQALAAQTNSTLVTLSRARIDLSTRSRLTGHDIDFDNEADSLAVYLGHTSHLTISTWPLTTGKSNNVTGNMEFRWRLNGSSAFSGNFQFRVDEKDVKVFALGTSKDVL